MSDSLFKRTGSADFPNRLKAMLSGPPKSGKTSFLGTVPNIVIADTEPHANNLQSVAHLNLPYVTIHSTSDLQNLRMVLANESLRQQAAASLGMDTIEAVAIDTLDTLQKIMKRERLADTRQAQFLRDDWAWLKEEMTKIIEAFTSLPLHVFFCVHLKTQELGKGDDTRTIVLPGLEGSVASDIAGMVGYSLLTFRNEQLRPNGEKFTKYWLRAEGDETYEFLGNRAAGRLPDVIEPDFKALYAAAMAGRPTRQTTDIPMPALQTTQAAPQPAASHVTPQSLPTQTPVQTQPPQEVAQNPGQSAPVAPGMPQPGGPSSSTSSTNAAPDKPGDDEPVTSAAMQHMKKVYDALGQPFPEQKLTALNLGQARTLVQTWRAIQQDDAEGKTPQGVDLRAIMLDYLKNMDLLADEPKAPAAEAQQVEAKIDGTIDQVRAYVGEDIGRAQQAYDLEAAKEKPRASLISWLESKGARPPVAPTSAPVEPITQHEPTAEAVPTEEEAVDRVKEQLGGEVVNQESREDRPCEECGKPVDDVDIARLSESRFGRWLCVSDYITQTKK